MQLNILISRYLLTALITVALCLTGLLAAFAPTVLAAQPTTLKIKVQDSGFTSSYKRIPDARGHVLSLAHRKGQASLADGQSAEYEAFSIIDAWIGVKGIRTGYSSLSFKDGSKIFYSWHADSKRNKDNLPSLIASGSITRGTGKYLGIKGKVEFTSLQLKPTSQDSKRTRLTDLSLSFTLPDKKALTAGEKRLEMTITHQGQRAGLLPAGDEPGHVIGMGKRQGEVVLSDGGKAEFSNVYTTEAWRGKKTIAWSNVRLSFPDGSWIYIKNTTILGAGRSGQGKGEAVSGGGRFKGITGRFETRAQPAAASAKLPKGARRVKATLFYRLP